MKFQEVSAEEMERVKNCTCYKCQLFRRVNGLPVIKNNKKK